jgi:dCMP deaminase
MLGCEISVHGEANAIAFAAKNGIRLVQSRLYTTLSPCYKCAQLIINVGVEEVVYLEAYRDLAGVDLLANAGLEVVQYGHD